MYQLNPELKADELELFADFSPNYLPSNNKNAIQANINSSNPKNSSTINNTKANEHEN